MILKSPAKWKRDVETFEGLFILSKQTWYECASNFSALQIHNRILLQTKVDDHKSVAATMIREVERNKL